MPQILVIWQLEKVERPAVPQVGANFRRKPFAEHIYWRVDFGVPNHLVPLLQVVCFEALPRERGPQEVDQHVAQRFQVIPAGLLLAQVSVDGHVPCSARQRLVLSVWDVVASLRVNILLAQPKINNVDSGVAVQRPPAHKKVFRLDVSVDNVLRMNVLQPGDQLDPNHAHCLQRKLSIAHVKQIFQTWPQQLEHQRIVLAARSKRVDLRHPNLCSQELIKSVFQVELRSSRFCWLQLDGNILIVVQIFPCAFGRGEGGKEKMDGVC